MTRLTFNRRYARCDSYDDAADLEAERDLEESRETYRQECAADDQDEED